MQDMFKRATVTETQKANRNCKLHRSLHVEALRTLLMFSYSMLGRHNGHGGVGNEP